MNSHRYKPSDVWRLCAMAVLALLVAATARAHPPAGRAGDSQQNEKMSATARAYGFNSLLAPAGWHPTASDHMRKSVEGAISKEFDKAWRLSLEGMNGCEAVVLIFQTSAGGYKGELQHFTNEYKQSTFKWNPAALAIVHTHPNSSAPQPTAQDRRVAERYGVPNFTISVRGMYVYDPLTKKTSKVLDGLEWLDSANLSRWTQVIARLIAERPRIACESGSR